MNISGIKPHSGFYNTDIKTEEAELSGVGINQPEGTKAGTSIGEEQIGASVNISEAGKKQSGTFGTYDYANQYRPNNSFDIKSIKTDLKGLDIERAIGDMQRDQMLHHYQTFVGEKGGGMINRPLEDFTL